MNNILKSAVILGLVTFQSAVCAGTYRDEAGVALGAFHYLNDNVLLNTAASYSAR